MAYKHSMRNQLDRDRAKQFIHQLIIYNQFDYQNIQKYIFPFQHLSLVEEVACGMNCTLAIHPQTMLLAFSPV